MVVCLVVFVCVQVHASLIVVLTRGGSTGRLVAKYRPLVPVLTVAVPVLTTDSLTWTCSNEAPARQVSPLGVGGTWVCGARGFRLCCRRAHVVLARMSTSCRHYTGSKCLRLDCRQVCSSVSSKRRHSPITHTLLCCV